MLRYTATSKLFPTFTTMAQQSRPELPPDHRVFHQGLLELIHPTINWGEDESRENAPERNPTKNDDDVE